MANDVFYFNPTSELAVANGSFSYMPPRLLRDFEQDCSVLPFVFGTSNDFVLTEKKPSPEFINRLRDAGFELPEFCSLKELDLKTGTPLGTIFPWGWSPSAHFILKNLKAKCGKTFQESPVFNWTEKQALLFERITSLGFLKKFISENPFDFFIQENMTGIKVDSIAEIENLLQNKHPLVLKAPLSSSGRGIQIIRKSMLNTSNRQWIKGILNQQNYLVAEPFLEKITDLSFQFKISDHGQAEYLGFSVFETNTNGQYQGTFINPKIGNFTLAKILEEAKTLLEITAASLTEGLKDSVFTQLHRGFLGIDAMIYMDRQKVKMQPCIEINSRMNMGILTMQIEKKIHEQTSGKFGLFYGAPGDFKQFATTNVQNNPLKMRNGKLSSGFLSLVEPDGEKQFGAYILLQTAT